MLILTCVVASPSGPVVNTTNKNCQKQPKTTEINQNQLKIDVTD